MTAANAGGGFDPAWLDLRESADHRSRNEDLSAALARRLGRRAPVSVLDLGCGTGSNLRATVPLLGPEQHWTLVDADASLLEAALARLCAWAGRAERNGSRLVLTKDGKRVAVRFVCADLALDLERLLEPGADLVTASALFDLASDDFIATLAAEVARRRAAFLAVLTYNGVQRWTPRHEADAVMALAFRTHQARDKGLGPAAGPIAPALLAAAFDEAGYAVSEGDSGWRLEAGERGAAGGGGGAGETSDAALIEALAKGFAAAVRETRLVPDEQVADWLRLPRTGALVGHTDTLAWPG
jgi:SAM-dependent methyltransferase